MLYSSNSNFQTSPSLSNITRPPHLGITKLSSLPKNEKILEHYKLIGHSLSLAENKYFLAGIPFLFFNKNKVSKNKKSHSYQENKDLEKNVFSFMRFSLSPIPTKSIELYLEDLYSSSNKFEPINYKVCSINKLSPLFKMLFTFSFTFLFVTYEYALSQTSFVNVEETYLKFFIYFFGFSLGLFLCSDFYRRLSFASLLEKEVARRTGRGGNGSKRQLNLCLEE